MRKRIIQMAYRAGAIHIPSALSIVDIVSVLYGEILTDGDCVILSKGHGVMALYAVAIEQGKLTQEEADTYLQDGSRLFGLSDSHAPGCVISSGSLGHGLPIATGIALGLKKEKSPGRVFCIVGDGELQAGPNWEAIQFAAHHELDNLVLIVDDNGFQALGLVRDVLIHSPLAPRLTKFGWLGVHVGEATGATGAEIKSMVSAALKSDLKVPRGIVVSTIKGSGIPFMEHDNSWHYQRMTEDHYRLAMKELNR